MSTTILYCTTRNCLCGSPGCGYGACSVQSRHSEVLTFLAAFLSDGVGRVHST
ncbi:MAG: hypothetical protein AAF063_06000 [Cyanobacteria bacterium J06643_5]